MTLEQAILEKVRSLPIEKQQAILNFADSLTQKSHAAAAEFKTDWQNNPSIGMWKDREDMQDSTDWVRQTRKQEWGQ
jgi:hypothetical protein